MITSPIPNNEAARLSAVKELAILDTPAEKRFDRITNLAIKLFAVPISTLTIMDSDREWFKSCQGLEKKEGPRAIAFCGHVVAMEKDVLIVEDTLKDERFVDNPMVTGEPHIRFYAGVPIFSLSDDRIGVFCIKDVKPRALSESEIYLLKTLASWVELEVNMVSLRKVLDEGQDVGRLEQMVKRLVNRDAITNLKSIKLGLGSKMRSWSKREIKECEESIDYIKILILKIESLEANAQTITSLASSSVSLVG